MILREIAYDVANDRGTPAVLVVDDDPTSRLLGGAALKDQMSVVEAENGLAAVEALERQAFDIAILDLDMPVMDGFAVIERARARPETRFLPIIVVTGREDVVSIERAFALGATSFLCKPINWNVFRHQVGYVLHMAQVERKLRAENARLERVASLRARSIAALAREIEQAAARIAQLPAGDPATAREAAEACDRLRRLMRRIGRASAILTGAAELSLCVADARALADAAIAKVEVAHGARAAARIEVAASEALDVLCDSDAAEEALFEILTNALDASPSHEKIQLRIVDQPPSRVRFEIADRGPGISEFLLESGIDDLAAGETGWGVEPRPGLGLVLAKAIVEKHGGHFGIVSEPGRATEVFLSFPSAEERALGQPSVNRAAQIAS